MSDTGSVNLLLVDDQPAKLLSYEAILSDLDVNLIKANSGSQALEHLLKTDFAVVLLDVCMPDVDGFELASLIRRHPRCEKTAIILVSAVHMTDLDRLRGYGSGAVDYVPVPIVPEVLRAKVNVFVDLYVKTRQLQILNRELETRVAERTADLEASAARLRQSEEQLKEAHRRKDEFLAMLSHELRNPLAPIRNAVTILSLLGSNDKRLVQARDIVDRQTAHLTRLVDDLLDASRLTRGMITLKRETLPLADVIDGALEATRTLIEQNEHSIAVNLPAEPILVDGDRARLIQVATNLLTNAAKFTPKGGHISITVEHSGMNATLRVRDTGVGIPKEAQERVFQLFAQEEKTLARSHGGLGIGLTLVKQIVELHGGHVELESEGEQRGTELRVHVPTLSLPILLSDAKSKEKTATQTGPLRVLVIDDNVDSAQSFQVLLELSGHEVVILHDGLAALRVVEEFDPHVAFVDLGLPGLDGFEVARRILKHRRTPPVLIALSGYGREEDKQQTKAVGFHNHLVKPVDYESVLEYLAKLGASTIPRDRSATVH